MRLRVDVPQFSVKPVVSVKFQTVPEPVSVHVPEPIVMVLVVALLLEKLAAVTLKLLALKPLPETIAPDTVVLPVSVMSAVEVLVSEVINEQFTLHGALCAVTLVGINPVKVVVPVGEPAPIVMGCVANEIF